MSNPYGRRIIEARKKLGIGQRKAAKLWGFDDSTIQAWEHERRQPQGLYREKLEEVLRRVEDKRRSDSALACAVAGVCLKCCRGWLVAMQHLPKAQAAGALPRR